MQVSSVLKCVNLLGSRLERGDSDALYESRSDARGFSPITDDIGLADVNVYSGMRRDRSREMSEIGVSNGFGRVWFIDSTFGFGNFYRV